MSESKRGKPVTLYIFRSRGHRKHTKKTQSKLRERGHVVRDDCGFHRGLANVLLL